MRTFKAKIGTADQANPDFEALLEVGGGQLVITAGDQQIGAWPVTSLQLDLTNRGYRMHVDGEQLLVAPIDRFTFRDAVDAERQSVQPKGRRARRKAKVQPPSLGAPPVPTKRELKQAAKLERLRQEADTARAKEEAKADAKARAKEERKSGVRFRLPGRAVLSSISAALEPKPEPDAPWEIPVEKEPVEIRRNPLAARLAAIPPLWKIGAGASVVILAIGVFFPRLIATLLLVPGLLAVMTAGLGLVDPGYTRKLPPSLNEQRLLTGGGILLALGLLIVTFF